MLFGRCYDKDCEGYKESKNIDSWEEAENYIDSKKDNNYIVRIVNTENKIFGE